MDVSLNKVGNEKVSEYKERCLRTFIEYIEIHFIFKHKFEVLYYDGLIDKTYVPPDDLIDEKFISFDGSLICITKDKVFFCFARSVVGNLKFYMHPLKDIYEFINNFLTNHVTTSAAIHTLIGMDELPDDLPIDLKNEFLRLRKLKKAASKEAKKDIDFLNDYYKGQTQLEKHRDMMTHFKSGNIDFVKKFLPKNYGGHNFVEENSPLVQNYLTFKLEKLVQSDMTKKINTLFFNEKN